MLLGLVSDSHDNLPALARVADFFRERRVEQVFHLGDVTSPETLDALDGLPVVVLRGNNDEETRWPTSWRQELAGVAVGATHGHLRGELARLQRECALVLHGHTHRRRAERVGGAFVVNPGALYRTDARSCALLELPSMRIAFYRVEEEGVGRL